MLISRLIEIDTFIMIAVTLGTDVQMAQGRTVVQPNRANLEMR